MTERPSLPASRRRRLGALPVAALAVALGLACAPPAHAAQTAAAPLPARVSAATPPPTPVNDEAEPESETEGPALTLTVAARGVVAPGAAVTAQLAIDGADGAVDAGTAVLELGRQPLADRAALRAWMRGVEQGVTLTRAATGDTPAVAEGQSELAGITIPATDPSLQGLAPGVYPLRATLHGETAHSVVIVAERAEPVALIVPITAPPLVGGLLSADRLAELTGPEGALTAQLEGVAGTRAILAVDPAIPAAIRVLGSTAPASAIAWLERLEMLSNQRFALQFGDADVAAQLRAGLSAPLQPTGLGSFVPATLQEQDSATPTPTPTPDAEPEIPDLAGLLDVGASRDALYWPLPGDVDAEVLSALRAADPDATVLVPSDTTDAGRDGSAVAARGEGTLVYDAAASSALDAVAREDDSIARGASAVAASAELWFAGSEAGDAPVLVALDRASVSAEAGDAAPGTAAARLDAAVDVAATGAAVTPLGLTELLDAQPRSLSLTPADPDEPRAAFVEEIVDAERRVSITATVLSDPTLLTGRLRAEALQALAVGWRDRTDDWIGAVGAYRASVDEAAGAVAIEPTTTVQLLSAGAVLPVWIRNDLPFPAEVTLVAHPDSPRLGVAERTTVTARGDSSTRVDIPVEARVGSGDVTLDLSLVSAAGKQIGPPQTIEVTVRAEWERIGLGVLAALVAGLIGTGIVRTIRRGRRGRPTTDA